MADKLTIGVLTSGGDAPGMNAAIRAVVRTALTFNAAVRRLHMTACWLHEGAGEIGLKDKS